MKLRIVKIGRVAYPELRTLASMYEERLGAFVKIEGLELKDDDGATRLLEKLTPGSRVIALDERGREFTSRELADKLRQLGDDPAVKDVTFVIGGPMGLPPALKERADMRWALSKGTFTSDMAWLLCWEQIYRGFTIVKGTGYHHD